MASIDVFNQDPFTVMESTGALNKIPHLPNFLESLNIFTPKPIKTEMVSVEKKDGVLSIIQTSERGAPLAVRGNEKPDVRYFKTRRIAKADKLTASEIQGIRAFGTDSELKNAQDEVMAKSIVLRNEVNLTKERMRLGAIQGLVLDANGDTIIDWAAAWDTALPTEIDFDLDNASPASGALAKKCTQVLRGMEKAAKGAWVGSSYAISLCGDTFFDQLLAHPEYREIKLANPATAGELAVAKGWREVFFGGIRWVNYRGTDDGTTVAIGATKAKFFPMDTPGVFEVALSPLESLETANTPGLDIYLLVVPDPTIRNMYVDIEVYSYPLFMCKYPEMLYSARNT